MYLIYSDLKTCKFLQFDLQINYFSIVKFVEIKLKNINYYIQ
jgi:hypothetical protein